MVQDGSLDLAAMQEAAQHLVGEHDFRNFCKADVAQVRQQLGDCLYLYFLIVTLHTAQGPLAVRLCLYIHCMQEFGDCNAESS
jgi:hypothetical protein